MEYSFYNARRIDIPEKMDAPGVPLSELARAHKELRIINKLLGGYSLLIESLDEVDHEEHIRSVIDIGCGSGDNLRVLAEHFKRMKRRVSFTGIDINPDAIDLAKSYSRRFPEITYHSGDVWQPFGNADVVTCSLFCHHFNDEMIVKLINQLILSANKAVVINDLHRHWFAYHSINLLTKLFSGSDLVRHDAPLSVARSFSRKDWDAILSQCNFRRYTLKWKWAWRWQLIIYK